MILRVIRARTSAPGALATEIGGSTMSVAFRARGLLSFQAGFREDAEGTEFILATTWRDFDALVETIGPTETRPRWLGDAPYDGAQAEHYELVGTPLTGIVPLDGSIIRVLRGRLRPEDGAEYFELTRELRERLIMAGGTFLTHLGRRMVGRHQEAIVVSVWRDASAIARHGGAEDRPVGTLEAERYFESWRLETYHASPEGAGQMPVACPAVIVMDDERRYRYATPEAAALHGIPLGRLLGQRVDDGVPAEARPRLNDAWDEFRQSGSSRGEGTVPQPDGSTIAVGFRAKADFPWEGAHTVVIAPTAPDEVPDVAAALAACAISVN